MTTSYRDHLARKGLSPIVIERSQKRGGDLVLGNAALPVRVVPGIRGRFSGMLS